MDLSILPSMVFCRLQETLPSAFRMASKMRSAEGNAFCKALHAIQVGFEQKSAKAPILMR